MSNSSFDVPPMEQPIGLSLDTQIRSPGVVVLHLRGDVDIATTPELERALRDMVRAAQAPARLSVDLSDVGFISAHGLRTLETAAIEANYHGHRFGLSGCNSYLVNLLELLEMTALLPGDGTSPDPATDNGPGAPSSPRSAHSRLGPDTCRRPSRPC